MINKILEDVTLYKAIVDKLFNESPYFPEYIERAKDGVRYFSTIVRKKHEEKWYTIHVINYGIPSETYISTIFNRFLQSVYTIILFGSINPDLVRPTDNTPVFPLDKLQISEEERLHIKIS